MAAQCHPILPPFPLVVVGTKSTEQVRVNESRSGVTVTPVGGGEDSRERVRGGRVCSQDT